MSNKINKKLHTIEFKLKKLLNWGLFGNYKSKVSGAWMEFDEHKNYSSWDSIRDIDWKASSKTQELFVKKYEQEKDLKVLFVLDTGETMNFGSEDKTKKETLIETFYALALSAYYNNDNVWAIIYNEDNLEFLDYKKSKNNIYRILEKISPHLASPLEERNSIKNSPLLQRRGAGGEGDYLDEIKNRRIKNNLIFILTDNRNFDLNKLKFLSQNNDIIVINIFDKFENELLSPHLASPKGRGIIGNLTLNLWKSFLNIDLADKEKKEEFKKLRQKKIEKTIYDLEKNNIWYIFLDNKSDIVKELIKYFK